MKYQVEAYDQRGCRYVLAFYQTPMQAESHMHKVLNDPYWKNMGTKFVSHSIERIPLF